MHHTILLFSRNPTPLVTALSSNSTSSTTTTPNTTTKTTYTLHPAPSIPALADLALQNRQSIDLILIGPDVRDDEVFNARRIVGSAFAAREREVPILRVPVEMGVEGEGGQELVVAWVVGRVEEWDRMRAARGV